MSSGLFGTVYGSAVANVLVDGIITIPLMKRTGFKAAFAGAIEATASTGGQLAPPVMGAAAFILADIVGVSYASVAYAAIVPALLYASLYSRGQLQPAHGPPTRRCRWRNPSPGAERWHVLPLALRSISTAQHSLMRVGGSPLPSCSWLGARFDTMNLAAIYEAIMGNARRQVAILRRRRHHRRRWSTPAWRCISSAGS